MRLVCLSFCAMQNRILSYYLIFSVCVPAAFLVNVHRDVTDVTRERLPYRYDAQLLLNKQQQIWGGVYIH